jgi:hypothetical protein
MATSIASAHAESDREATPAEPAAAATIHGVAPY